jgi:hypothetical protein
MQTECIEQVEQRVTGWGEEIGTGAKVGCVRCPMGVLYGATDVRAVAECMLLS